MDIKDLEIFLAIAHEKSIAKASKRLYMTPQGISKVVKNLEQEMNCRLFMRSSFGMLLTESGERFLEYAEKDTKSYYNVKMIYYILSSAETAWWICFRHMEF